ncbi:hypothetical protein [Desulfofundulus thermocisternus]|uniref:hypothetical protein n=1 Tax=Desulfofundulus thermocisternus TaxID=42471 RepID=UPI0012FF00DF|nr:hypothetical protein [Desulfofundulus thermocisternus]
MVRPRRGCSRETEKRRDADGGRTPFRVKGVPFRGASSGQTAMEVAVGEAKSR